MMAKHSAPYAYLIKVLAIMIISGIALITILYSAYLLVPVVIIVIIGIIAYQGLKNPGY